MPPGHLTAYADPTNSSLLAALRARVPLHDAPDAATADVVVSATVPDRTGTQVIVTGMLTDDLDTWDTQVAPQTVAGALWLPPDQPDRESAALAWLLLRLQTPTTPLSDLTDTNGRALRWSVVAAQTLAFLGPGPVAVDEAEVTAWVDAQPAVQELGTAVQRVGGESAAAVLESVERLRGALTGLDPLTSAAISPSPALDTAVAEHLRQVQRTGFARWRAAKARVASQADLQAAAKLIAGERLQAVIDARRAEVAATVRAEQHSRSSDALVGAVTETAQSLELPVTVDFAKVPRSWAADAPSARCYVFTAEEQADLFQGLPMTVRPSDLIERGTVVCAVVQSGFSLPALR